MQRNSLITNCPHVVFDFRTEFHESSRLYFWNFTSRTSVLWLRKWKNALFDYSCSSFYSTFLIYIQKTEC
jgi:hypothetical protein